MNTTTEPQTLEQIAERLDIELADVESAVAALRHILADPAILAHVPAYAELQEVVSARNAECTDLDARCTDLSGRIAELQAENERLKESAHQLHLEYAHDLSEKNDRIADLESQLAAANEKLAAHDVLADLQEERHAEQLEAAYREGFRNGADAEYIGEEAEQNAFNQSDTNALCIAIEQGEQSPQASAGVEVPDDIARNALHQISLCSQNSLSSKEECGQIARKALGAAHDFHGVDTQSIREQFAQEIIDHIQRETSSSALHCQDVYDWIREIALLSTTPQTVTTLDELVQHTVHAVSKVTGLTQDQLLGKQKSPSADGFKKLLDAYWRAVYEGSCDDKQYEAILEMWNSKRQQLATLVEFIKRMKIKHTSETSISPELEQAMQYIKDKDLE